MKSGQGVRWALGLCLLLAAAFSTAAASSAHGAPRGSPLKGAGVSGRASSPKPRVGGISYSITWLRWLQRQVDRGNRRYRFYLDPVQATLRSLPHLGYTGSPLQLVLPPRPRPAPTAHRGEDGLPETDVVVRWRGRQYWVVLNQFVRAGPHGIWSVITITAM